MEFSFNNLFGAVRFCLLSTYQHRLLYLSANTSGYRESRVWNATNVVTIHVGDSHGFFNLEIKYLLSKKSFPGTVSTRATQQEQ